MLYSRRSFLTTSSICSLGCLLPLPSMKLPAESKVMTVQGDILPGQLGITLSHEHVLVDFIGATAVSPDRYDANEAFQKVVPYLEELKKMGCQSFVECTPNYLGRDVRLLKRLSEATGLQILTNTGYYGARNGIFLPDHVATESPEQLARRWVQEFENGIDGTDIRPGFIKIGVNNHPIPEYDRKIVKAAALTHLDTGLTIAAHTGDAGAAFEELSILRASGVHPNAFIWVHAQEKGTEHHIKAAEMGAWVEIDGVNENNYQDYARQVNALKGAGYLSQVLVSCDAGWYHVGEPEGGTYRTHTTIFSKLIPALEQLGFSQTEVQQLLVNNPATAFTIRVRKP